MILLHGGLPIEMAAAFLGGFLSSLALFIFMLMKGRRRLNAPGHDERSSSEKRIGLIKLLVIASLVSFVSFYFFVFLFGWMATFFS